MHSRTLTNIPMRFWTHWQMQPGAVVYTNMAKINFLSFERGRYFITFIDEASDNVKYVYMVRNSEPDKHLKRLLLRMEHQTEATVKKAVLHDVKEYIMGSRELEEDGIEIFISGSYIAQKLDRLSKWIATYRMWFKHCWCMLVHLSIFGLNTSILSVNLATCFICEGCTDTKKIW